METKQLISNLLKSSTSIREGELLKALLTFYTENENESTSLYGSIADIEKKNKTRDIKISNISNEIDNINESISNDVAYYSVTESLSQSISNKVNYITIEDAEEKGTNVTIELYLPTDAQGGDRCMILFTDKREDTSGAVTTSVYIDSTTHTAPVSLKSVMEFIYIDGSWRDIENRTRGI